MKTLLSIMTAFACLSIPLTALAVCADPYECVCVGGALTVLGTTKAKGDAGVSGTATHVTVERMVLRFGATTTFGVGDDVPLSSNDGVVGPGRRVLAGATLSSTGAVNDPRIGRVLDGKAVSCSGATFTEVESIDVALAPSCSDAIGGRIKTSECDDTPPGGCAVTSSSPHEPRPDAGVAAFAGAFVVLAVAVRALRRRRCARS